MEINIPTPFIKAKENIQHGDTITLLGEGEYKEFTGQDGKTKEILQFEAQLPNGDKKTYTMNITTQKNLISEWGKESKNWVGKPLKAWITQQLSFGKTISVLIFTPDNWVAPTKEEDADIPTINEEAPPQDESQ